MNKRPSIETGSNITTPKAEGMIRLLGPGLVHGGVVLTGDETRSLNRLYGFKPEMPNDRPPKPVRKPDPETATAFERQRADEAHVREVRAWENWKDPRDLMQAGADRNMLRHAEADGLRLVAWLARFVLQGEDPVKTLIQLASDAGFDVSADDIAYAEGE